MGKVWWYDINFERFGPVDAAELKRLFIVGRVQAGTPVWRAGMSDWVFFGGVDELRPDWQRNELAPPALERLHEASEKKASALRREGQRRESDREALDRLAPLPTPSRLHQCSPVLSTLPQPALDASPGPLPVPQLQGLAPAGPWRRLLARTEPHRVSRRPVGLSQTAAI